MRATSEVAKERIAQIGGSVLYTGHRPGYISPVLQQLRTKRDQRNGLPYSEWIQAQRPPWEQEINRCEEQRIRSFMTPGSDYRNRELIWKAEEMQLRKEEIRRHASGLSAEFGFDVDGRYLFMVELLQRELERFGFLHDQQKTVEAYPVFSKSIL
jgi:hypothetical protein